MARTHDQLPIELVDTVAALLRYSYEPISYDYQQLTPEEQAIVTEPQFERLAQFAQQPVWRSTAAGLTRGQLISELQRLEGEGAPSAAQLRTYYQVALEKRGG